MEQTLGTRLHCDLEGRSYDDVLEHYKLLVKLERKRDKGDKPK